VLDQVPEGVRNVGWANVDGLRRKVGHCIVERLVGVTEAQMEHQRVAHDLIGS
jgi:hypothetical protein